MRGMGWMIEAALVKTIASKGAERVTSTVGK